jgi:hypothetical protein
LFLFAKVQVCCEILHKLKRCIKFGISVYIENAGDVRDNVMLKTKINRWGGVKHIVNSLFKLHILDKNLDDLVCALR